MGYAQKWKLSIRQARYAAAIAAGKPALQELVGRGTQSLMQARVGMRSSSGPHPLKVSLLESSNQRLQPSPVSQEVIHAPARPFASLPGPRRGLR
jgi:hypothetical protein